MNTQNNQQLPERRFKRLLERPFEQPLEQDLEQELEQPCKQASKQASERQQVTGNRKQVKEEGNREQVKGKGNGEWLKGREAGVTWEQFEAHRKMLLTIPDPLDALLTLKAEGNVPNEAETYRALKRAKNSLMRNTRYDHLIEKIKSLPIASLPLRNGLPEAIRRVAALCFAISETSKGNPFPLSQEEVARLFPACNSREAGRLLIDVVDEGALQRVRAGNGTLATTWKWISQDEEAF
jgi:hypothetical protein